MNKNYLYSTALLLLMSCSQDSLTGENEKSGVAINVTTAVTEGEGTRAATHVQEAQFDAGESFYVYFADNKATVANAKFTTSDANGSTVLAASSTQPFFANGENSVTLHAYYPETVTESSTSFSVLDDQISDANFKLSDLMYATKEISRSGVSVTAPLLFTHKLAKIVVVVQAAAGISNITNVSIINGYRTIDITNGTACALGTGLSDAITVSSPITLYDDATGTTSVSSAAMLPPQAVSGNFIKITTASDGDAIYNVAKTFVSGHSYTVVLNLSKAGLARTLGVTSDWGNPEEVYTDPAPTLLM